ncbi:MAG: hypothetical protein RL434_3068 [Pseudomonadota bacterium]|jgi:predicted Zn-dependent protease
MSRLLLLVLSLILAKPMLAEEAPEARFAQAVSAFGAKNYALAAGILEPLVAASPDNDRYVYWLGKAYGRQAEQAGWFEAVRLAKRTRKALEKAVTLNPRNTEALRDLAQFYDEAPGFLGGDAAKAAQLRAELATLEVRPAP